MDAVFLKLVQLSITASLLVAAVLVLRLVLRRAPKWVFCLLWGVVALRLLVPVSVESVVSLVPESIASGELLTQVTQEPVGRVDVIYQGAELYQQAVDAGRQPVHSDRGYYVVTEPGSLEAPATVADTVVPVLSRVWLAGLAAMLLYTAASYLRIRRKVSTAVRLYGNIRQSEHVDSPFVLGLLRPVIYLPFHLPDGDMEHVIAHERAHIRRLDHLWKPLGFMILSVYWFNPLLWVGYVLLCRDIEAACDEKVIRELDAAGIRAYSTALLNCSIHRARIAACPLAFGEVGVKERIKRVMHYKKPAFWLVLLAVIVSISVGAMLLTNPVSEKPPAPVIQDDRQIILSLVDEIAYNTDFAHSSNPYDYIRAKEAEFQKILSYGETALDCLVAQLQSTGEDGLQQYIMAAACAELTGIGLDKALDPWYSGQSWLRLYKAKNTTEPTQPTQEVLSPIGISYARLIDSDEYLYEERWAAFLLDPEAYVRELAKRPRERLFMGSPNGIIPASSDPMHVWDVEHTVSKLYALLDAEPEAYEKEIIYRLLNTVCLSYTPVFNPEQVNYTQLVEQWDYALPKSTEEGNCLRQLSVLLDTDPLAFLRGFALVEADSLRKELASVTEWLAEVNYLYDAAVFQDTLDMLSGHAATDREKALVQALQNALDALEAPTLDAQSLISGSGEALWRAFLLQPETVVRNLGQLSEAQIRPLGQKLDWMEKWPDKLLHKALAGVNRVLGETPTGTLKHAAYKFLLRLEFETGSAVSYVPGQPYNYTRLFDKLDYADGAYAEMCYSELYRIFEADPHAFIAALSQGNWNTEHIATVFAAWHAGDAYYLQILTEIAQDKALEACVGIFLEKYRPQ